LRGTITTFLEPSKQIYALCGSLIPIVACGEAVPALCLAGIPLRADLPERNKGKMPSPLRDGSSRLNTHATEKISAY
jgi:hypothetical protein